MKALMRKCTLVVVTSAAILSMSAAGAQPTLTFTKLWTHGHTTPDQVSEIPAFDSKTNTIWVAGVVGVDVLDAETGDLVAHIDVTDDGFVNSVAIHNGLAAFAVEASGDRRDPGLVLLYDTRTRQLSSGVNEIPVGSLPDMLTFTHDGTKLLVANEGTPNVAADEDYAAPDPPGTVSIIDVATRTVVATAGFTGVPRFGSNLRTNTGMDFEPEYIAIDKAGDRAFVTLQEANGVAELDLITNTFTQIVGLGAKDFSVAGNEIDPKDNDGTVAFSAVAAKGLYMPDSVAAYRWRGGTYLALANEGDFREDNEDRAAASTFGAVAPLDRLRVSNTDSSGPPPSLFAAGARSFSIRDADGTLVYDSGSLLDKEAHSRGLYDDGRSRDKGVEPEGLALLDIRGRTYAFVGLERTLSSAVAVFDISNPFDVTFVDMIVTPGDRAPEGMAAYHHRGRYYLAIANETPATGGAPTNTTLYRLNP